MWFLLLIINLVQGDVYMHSPRGANDRNCERNVNRNNGNLLYDTQNNAKGGYACPRAVAGSGDNDPPNGLTEQMQFKRGSLIEVEWTAQHGCGAVMEAPPGGAAAQAALTGNENVHCEIVMEMACANTLDPAGEYGGATTANGRMAVPRDGIPNNDGDSATNRINTQDPGQAVANNNGNLRFGVQETPATYNECNRVARNRGLFTADQNVNRRSAIGTRQNPNGGRRGLECPEERDYFPYWRPSGFVAVAYLVDDAARCGTGAQPCGGPGNPACVGPLLSGDWVGNVQGFKVGQNTVEHGNCLVNGAFPKNNNGLNGAAAQAFNGRRWPNNAAACAALNAANVAWTPYLFHTSFDKAANAPLLAVAAAGPTCQVIDHSRSNHLGNTGSGDKATRFQLTIPNVNPSTGATANNNPCILRLRYNMSSSDYLRNLSSAANGNNSPIQQDPLVKIGTGNADVVALALNTNQVCRTFQDRSYVFKVTTQSTAVGQAQEINVNLRGKRGNIVQTYPAVEYDWIPNEIFAKTGDQVTFQWGGSDYNPRRGCNDGEGGPYVGDRNVVRNLNAGTRGSNQNSRTDRMNLVATENTRQNYPQAGALAAELGTGGLFASQAQAEKFAYGDAKAQLAARNLNCLTATEINNINNENQRENHPRNCAEANALSPYFSPETVTIGAAQADKKWTLYSSRNNNFSNRDSKALLFTSSTARVDNVPNTVPGGVSPTLLIGEVTAVENVNTAEVIYDDPDSAAVVAQLDADIKGYDPVENDDYGEGAEEGCTQMMMFYNGASTQYSVFSLICTILSIAYRY